MKIHRRFSSIERGDILLKSQQCLQTPDGKIGLDYLRTTRKLSEGCIQKFGLGYIPSFVRHQLCGRIIFPIYDPSENLVALGSRHIDGETLLPTYWHEAYEKDYYLYGAHIAKHSMMKWRFAVCVEGQFDAIRMHDHGMTNCVALCGTKFSDMQLAIIHRYCEEIVVVLDTDSNFAGQKASEKVREKIGYADESDIGGLAAVRYRNVLHSEDFKSKIITLSFNENLDPDEFISYYGIEHLKSLIRLKVQELRRGYQYH